METLDRETRIILVQIDERNKRPDALDQTGVLVFEDRCAYPENRVGIDSVAPYFNDLPSHVSAHLRRVNRALLYVLHYRRGGDDDTTPNLPFKG